MTEDQEWQGGSQLSIQLLVLAQVVISGSWNWTPASGSALSTESVWNSLPFSFCPSHLHLLSLSQRERVHTSKGISRERSKLSREPDVGLNPRTLGPWTIRYRFVIYKASNPWHFVIAAQINEDKIQISPLAWFLWLFPEIDYWSLHAPEKSTLLKEIAYLDYLNDAMEP